jgi:hypothetical protein
MKTIVITQQERRMATRPNVYKNRKKYSRKDKHKEQYGENRNARNAR